MAEPTTARLTSMHFYSWKKGLKTGMYYLRTRPKADAIQFTVDQTALAKSKQIENNAIAAADAALLLNKNPSAKAAASQPQDENAGPSVSNREAGMTCRYRGLDSANDGACEMCSA